jgi:asparagine synthase (glutamine-hydrolysing)
MEGACNALRHRGPDDSGIWIDEAAGVALGHTRLSILDLSAAGHQPMATPCGRYVVIFNGEIYNHLELRKEIEIYSAPKKTNGWREGRKPGQERWRGHSDTETLLACILAWGVEKTLRATVGMFAFAVWDRDERKLYLARDRLGEKPLYYGYVARAFTFGSELKALATLPGFTRNIDRGALALLMRHNYIPGPRSIYSGLAKLPPGTWLSISLDQVRRYEAPQLKTYWSAFEHASSGTQEPLTFGSDEQATDALEVVLKRAVASQMVADVPLGAFLSGGVDSSTVVALMQAQSARPVKTFSIGFRVEGYDEAPYAKAVARHLGTDHTEVYVSPADALAVIPKLPKIYDEPFSDSSQIPTYLLAKLARQHVTVSLSGDGGDELFGGYWRYFFAARLWRVLNRTPPALRTLAAKVILSAAPDSWDRLYRILAPLVPSRLRWSNAGDRLHKGAGILSARNGLALYHGLVSHWEPSEQLLSETQPSAVLSEETPSVPSLTESMMALDAVSYLPDDVLVKVDRAAMAVSLETRVPLLDHRVFEFAWRLPLRYKVRGTVGKWLLRKVLHRYVPQNLIDRPKMGFGIPIDSWLRGPLRDWCEALLDEARLRREGYFNPAPIRRKWREHLSGKRNWQYHLWDVLMFQAWLESQPATSKRTAGIPPLAGAFSA